MVNGKSQLPNDDPNHILSRAVPGQTLCTESVRNWPTLKMAPYASIGKGESQIPVMAVRCQACRSVWRRLNRP